ncbi:MAG: YebC/PmpR family DNA-binding transcriptional regulator [Rhodospirillales bacterium]|nr:YebC/PmpR family DNA-binding transcriptional regulator [Rhodospirillales bacterium]
MAGHSQFKNIMYRKGAQDKKRAKIFAKLTREIIVAANSGLPDPAANPRLRSAIQAARAENMPKDNIERTIKRATGGDDAVYEEIRYEGYGPGGVAIIVEALTDNRNRTASDLRAIFSKNGGSMGETNSVAFMFDRVGYLAYPGGVAGADEIFEAAVEMGAIDVQSSEGLHEIFSAPEDFSQVRDALSERYGDPRESHLSWRPNNGVPVEADAAQTLMKLIDALEDNDDVQTLAVNFDISEELLASLAG